MDTSKQCGSCEVLRPASDFAKSSRAKSGLQTYCRPCRAEMQRNDPGRVARVQRYITNRPAESHYRHLRRRAETNGVECCSKDVFVGWFNLQARSCVYCGDSDQIAREKYGRALNIDRKDPDGGYMPSNICLACHRCNVVKSRYLTHEQMFEVAQIYFLGEKRSNSHAALVAALREAIDLAWVGDSHSVKFDRTVMFGGHYDFDGLDGSCRQEFLGQYECVVWPGPKWSAYCTFDGSMWFEKFDSADEAKEMCMRLLDRVLPGHPAMKARAALAAAEA